LPEEHNPALFCRYLAGEVSPLSTVFAGESPCWILYGGHRRVNHGLTGFSFGYIVVVAFWTVLLAELVADKSIYGIASLSLRFRPAAVFTGITLAYSGKMLAAVLLAKVLAQFHFWTDLLSAVAFFVSAIVIWLKEPEPVTKEGSTSAGWWRAIVVCFASIFLTEWGDPSQIAVAALSVKSHLMLAPWLGGTLAMAVKGGLAMVVGIKLRDRLPQTTLRTLATASFCVLGILALRGLWN
jgi:putative Ca2+/H+ antiporter (TMEM165/GDT1 family)